MSFRVECDAVLKHLSGAGMVHILIYSKTESYAEQIKNLFLRIKYFLK